MELGLGSISDSSLAFSSRSQQHLTIIIIEIG